MSYQGRLRVFSDSAGPIRNALLSSLALTR